MIASVIVDILNSSVDRVYDYTACDNCVEKGSRVMVPFGGRYVEGYVIDIKQKSDVEKSKLKSIIKVIDKIPSITQECLNLLFYMKSKYHVLLAEALRLFIPAQLRGGRVREKTAKMVYLCDTDFDEIIDKIGKRAQKQIEAAQYLKKNGEQNIALLSKKFGRASITALIKKGLAAVKTVELIREPYTGLKANDIKHKLTERQKYAVDAITGGSGIYLLFGVTGSGKTEIYLNCIEKMLEKGKSAIMTVPEIALTPQIMKIFRSRFGGNVALLHSGLSAGERLDEWNRLRRGEAKIAVGARSAIFAPLENIGIIIIDEQHEQSYISENSPRYDAKEIAEFRAKYNNCPLVMGSATPLVESFYYACQKKYKLIEIPQRISGEMPEIHLVDMVREVRAGNNSFISSALREKMQTHLEKGNQIILFINRRGYSPIVICSSCGYIAKCTDCDVTLNYHKADGQLKCHYCGNRYEVLGKCPQCGSDKIRKSGTGTQKVCDELAKIFPPAKVLRMDNDTTQNKEAHLNITQKFANRQADILVGTQMIAKGHDFAGVTLVGVLDADLSLYFSDYRSVERTFSLITQVAGRAGRADKSGEVIVQTHTPYHYVYRMICDYNYKGFYQREISLREAAKYPPFAKILRVLCISEEEDKAREAVKNIYSKIKDLKQSFGGNFIYLNAMKAPVSKIKNKYRYQVLARVTDNDNKITDIIYDIVDLCRVKNVTSFLEVNPSAMH